MRFNRDSLAATLAVVAVAIVVVLGFWKTRGPSTQRLVRADGKRAQNLNRLAFEINNQYKMHASQLPAALNDAQKKAFADPVTGIPPTYTPTPPNSYTLCATFATASSKDEPNDYSGFWNHPAGTKCFEFNAADNAIPAAPYFY
jgi:hypothetical protein